MPELRRSYAMSHLPFTYELNGFIKPFVLGVDDASGDNIATRREFSETRGHYWLWRNEHFEPDEFVSIQQYRRSFFYPQLIYRGDPFFPESEALNRELGVCVMTVSRKKYIEYIRHIENADRAPLNAWLDSVDVVVNRPSQYPKSIAAIYGEHHRAHDWEVFAQICRENGYDDGRHPWLSGHLMFCMRPAIFDEYMQDWSKVMFEVDRNLAHEDDTYQHRKIGYLTERFMSAWLIKQRTERPTLRIQTLPIIEGLFQHDRPSPDVM